MIIQQSILLVKTSGGNFRRSLLFGILRYENFYDFFCFSYKRKSYFSFKTTKIISMYCQKRKSVIEYEITVYERVSASEFLNLVKEKQEKAKTRRRAKKSKSPRATRRLSSPAKASRIT